MHRKKFIDCCGRCKYEWFYRCSILPVIASVTVQLSPLSPLSPLYVAGYRLYHLSIWQVIASITSLSGRLSPLSPLYLAGYRLYRLYMPPRKSSSTYINTNKNTYTSLSSAQSRLLVISIHTPPYLQHRVVCL